MESVLGKKSVNLPYDQRPVFEIEEMKSPMHERCGFRNAQLLGTRGNFSFYRCNHCKGAFVVRELPMRIGRRKRL